MSKDKQKREKKKPKKDEEKAAPVIRVTLTGLGTRGPVSVQAALEEPPAPKKKKKKDEDAKEEEPAPERKLVGSVGVGSTELAITLVQKSEDYPVAKRPERRKEKPIETGAELADIVKGAIPRKAWPPKMHVATRTFMALRMEVNQELGTLDAVLPQALEALEPGGRLVVISFHSGEHARVKKFFKEMANPPHEVPYPLPQRGVAPEPRIKLLTRKPVTAQPEELATNPRSRSAQLRAAMKI